MLLELDHLILHRPPGLLAVSDECTLCDITGEVLARAAAEETWKWTRRLAKVLALDPYLPRSLRLDNAAGEVLLRARISATAFRSKLRIGDGQGRPVGRSPTAALLEGVL